MLVDYIYVHDMRVGNYISSPYIREEFEEEGVESDTEIRYNKRATKYIPYSKIEEHDFNAIRRTLYMLYQGFDNTIADNLAIEIGNTVYIADSGIERNKISFGVRKRIVVSDESLRKDFVRRENENAVRKGYIDNELSPRIGTESVDDRRRDRRQEFGKELSTNQRESENNEKRVSDENEHRRNGGVKYSLKSSGQRTKRTQSNGQAFSFMHKNFPPENEALSEAHRLAIWWARRSDVKRGDQVIVSMNDGHYLVEKFDDATNHYQVEQRIKAKDFKRISKEIKENGRSGRIKSIETYVDRLDSSDRQRNQVDGRKPSVDSLEARYGRKNIQIQGLGEDASLKWETPSNGNRDSESSGTYRQGTSLSDKKTGVQSSLKTPGQIAKEKAVYTQGKVYTSTLFMRRSSDKNIFLKISKNA